MVFSLTWLGSDWEPGRVDVGAVGGGVRVGKVMDRICQVRITVSTSNACSYISPRNDDTQVRSAKARKDPGMSGGPKIEIEVVRTYESNFSASVKAYFGK